MQLPAGAQTWQSCGFDSAWTPGEHLTAHVYDAIQAGNWQRTGDRKAQKPKPIPRPSDARRTAQAGDRNDVRARAFLARQRRAQQAQRTEQDPSQEV